MTTRARIMNHNYFNPKMSEACDKIFKYNQNHKSMKIQFVVYADTESLLEKISSCNNDPTQSFTSKINIRKTCAYLLFTQCSFDSSKSKHDLDRGEDFMKKFFADLKKHGTEITNLKKKETLPLTEKKKEAKNTTKENSATYTN